MKCHFSIFIFAAFFTVTTNAAFSQTIKPPDILAVKLTDGGKGFGVGREIEIVFERGGAATFRGGANSGLRKGVFRGAINRRQFERLTRLIVANSFFALENRYEGNVSDVGAKTISVVYKTGEKSVVNWGGSDLKEFAEIRKAICDIDAKVKWQPDEK